MSKKSNLELFMSYNVKRNMIVDFFNYKIKSVKNPNTLLEFNFGLFSLAKQINLNMFNAQIKHITANSWVKQSVNKNRVVFYDRIYQKDINNDLKLGDLYQSTLNVDGLKNLISKQIKIKNDKELEVIANTIKYTRNLDNNDKSIISVEGYTKEFFLNCIFVGDVVIMPLSTKKNNKTYNFINTLVKKGGSIILLEPLDFYMDDIDKNDQMIIHDTDIPFRISYHSLF